jgi:hypothetical protein
LKTALKKYVLLVVKIGISLALLAYLVETARHDPNFGQLLAGKKEVGRLGAALAACLVAVTLTILRWKLLVQTLGMRFPLRDALRIGYVGYLCNLLPLGLVGGDAVKMVLLSHLHPREKTRAIASVLVDRYLGLVALLVLAGGATFLIDFESLQLPPDKQQSVLGAARVIQAAALAGCLGIALLFVPGFTDWSLWKRLEPLPLLGGFLHRLMGAMHVYRGRADVLAASVGLSLAVHSLYAVMFYVVGGAFLDPAGAPTPRPALLLHFAFVPIGMAAGTLPIGAQEATLNVLYPAFLPPPEATIAANKGFLMALVYRMFQVTIACFGVAFYFASRRELGHISDETAEIEELEEHLDEELAAAPRPDIDVPQIAASPVEPNGTGRVAD